MTALFYVCFSLFVGAITGANESSDLGHQMEDLSSKMIELNEKLDRGIIAHQQTLAHMSSMMEHVTTLLHRVDVCAPSEGAAAPAIPTNKPPTSTVAVGDAWRDEVAQGTCTALLPSAGWMFAVRRECGTTRSCAQICASLAGQDSQITRMQCVDSLHVYENTHPYERGLKPSDVETLGTKVFRYFSCASTGCGPNFCCCSGY